MAGGELPPGSPPVTRVSGPSRVGGGYAYGMVAAARDPLRNASWITTMIGVQAVDWVATVLFLARGDLTFQQVTTAAFMPVVFVAALLRWHPRRLVRRGLVEVEDRVPAAVG